MSIGLMLAPAAGAGAAKGQPSVPASAPTAPAASAPTLPAEAAASEPGAARSAAPAVEATAIKRRWSQLTQTSFRNLRQEDGLPHDIVRAVAQDSDGFIWIGTPVGVARYDGYKFRFFKPDPQSPGKVPDTYVQALHADSRGRIWVGTTASGLMRYERDGDRFIQFAAGPQGLSHASVRSILDDGAGGVWVGTEGGLDRIDAAGKVERSILVTAEPAPDLRVASLMLDRRGGLWASTNRGLYRRDAGAAKFVAVPLPLPGVDAVEPTNLLQDRDGRIWIGTAQWGVFLIEFEGGDARPLREASNPGGAAGLDAASVSSLAEVQPGELWVGTRGAGIVSIETATRQTQRIRNVPTLPSSLPENTTFALFRDSAGLIWVSSNNGLSRHDPRQSAVLTMYGAPPADPAAQSAGYVPQELPVPANTKISWIHTTSPQRIWLGTMEGNVYVIDPSGVRVATLRSESGRPLTALPGDFVLGMAQAPDGSVFIATRRGVYRADAEATRATRVKLGSRDPASPTRCVLVVGKALWIGGDFDGLWKLDLDTGEASQSPRNPAGQLTDTRITTLHADAAGRIWAGTQNGLNRYDPESGEVIRIAAETRADGLSGSYISTMLTDRERRLWVGTYGGGFSILEPGVLGPDNPPRFRQLTSANGLHDDYINSALEDAAGRIWFSTDSGIAFVDPRTGAGRTLRRADGVAFATYWTGSAARTHEGELLFGGAGGMSIVRPNLLRETDYRPRLVVTELRVGGKSAPAERFFGTGVAQAGRDGEIAPLQIEPGANSLAVEFAATDYSAPERNRYSYRLEGFDTDWIETTADRRMASYTSLPPGHYRLLLRGSNRDGVWSDDVLALPVNVLPAWYETFWFHAAAALLALGALVGIVQVRTRFLRLRRQELERMVEERTTELRDVSRALQEKSRVLELTSISDPLTGLRNRRFLTQHIETEINASLRRALDFSSGTLPHPVDTDNVFLLIDIDHFKRVNDAHGHAAGDAVLVQFAQRLQSLMRETDYVVRWGGEEFLAVARNTDRGRAEELAERVRAVATERPFTIDGRRTLAISCSIGFACLPFVEDEPRALGWQDIVKLADLALLAAKRAGRNGWVGIHAGERATPEGLLDRVYADPQGALLDGEIRMVTNKPREEAIDALAPPEPSPAWPHSVV